MDILDGVRLIKENDKVLKAHSERPEGFEPKTREYVKSHYYGETGEFIDVGAYTGFYTFLALLNGANFATSFEPLVLNYDRMVANSKFNIGPDDSLMAPFALSDEKGLKMLRGKEGLTSGATILDVNAVNGLYKVKVIPADHYFDNLPEHTLIKIDVEGAEKRVLRGFKKLLRSKNITFIIEILGSTSDVDDILIPLGYKKEELDDTMYKYSNVGA